MDKEALVAQKAKLEAIVALEKGFAAKEAALSDTQDLAEVLLYAEAKLGEMLAVMKPKYTISSVKGTNRPQREEHLPENINKKQSHHAQQLSKNKEVIAQVVAKAREQVATEEFEDCGLAYALLFALLKLPITCEKNLNRFINVNPRLILRQFPIEKMTTDKFITRRHIYFIFLSFFF